MRKFMRSLVEHWHIWFSISALIFLLFLSVIQLYYFDRFKNHNRLLIWPRIFLIVFPSFIIISVAAFGAYELLPQSPIAHLLGENPEETARNIGNIAAYIGGVIATFIFSRWHKKNLPLQRIEFIDNILDRIFSEDERRVE